MRERQSRQRQDFSHGRVISRPNPHILCCTQEKRGREEKRREEKRKEKRGKKGLREEKRRKVNAKATLIPPRRLDAGNSNYQSRFQCSYSKKMNEN